MNNLKKILGIFGTLSFICLNVSFASTGIVNTPAARVREKASTDSEVITKVYEDDEIEILSEEGDWYQVKANGKTGYVSKSLIKTSEKKEETNTNTTQTNNVSTYTQEEPKNPEYKNVIIKDTSLKLLPNFASNELRVLTKDTEVKIEKEINNWVKISLTDNSIGWVLKNNITSKEEVKEEPVEEKTEENTVKEEKTVENKVEENTTANTQTNTVSENTETTVKNSKGKVNVETANVREKASKSSDIIERLDEGDEVTIVEEEGDWYKITSSKVSSGYVSKSLITLIKDEVSSRSMQENREDDGTATNVANNSSKGSDVVEFAKQYLGTSYVVGGKTPETGFDCSGFTRYVFKNFGYSLGSVASDQDGVGKVVERSDLQPGDLILFQNEGKTKIGHTGIYIGNNEFIHAANPDRGVVIDNLVTMSYYNERFVTARRIVE